MTALASEPEYVRMPDAPRGTNEHSAHVKVAKRVNDRGYRIGESHPNCKIDDETVNHIRELHELHGWGWRRISRMTGMSGGTVRKLLDCSRRGQVPSPDGARPGCRGGAHG